MVGRPGKFQPRFTSGQLDDLMQSNTDEAAYFTGAKLFENVRPLPQGGFTNADGSIQRARVRNVLAPYSGLSAPVLSAPSGGVAASAFDGNSATALSTHSLIGSAVVLQIDLGQHVAISAVDLQSFKISGGTALIEVDTSTDGGSWAILQGTQQVIATAHTRRIAAEPGLPVITRFLRVFVSAISNPNTNVTLGDVALWVESQTLATVRVRSFTFSRAEYYDVVFTDGHADIYGASGRVGCVFGPWTGSQVAEMKNVQQLDTMLIFHQGFFPVQLTRQGSATEWASNAAPFKNIPNYDFGDVTYTNGVAAQWQLQFFGPATGNHYTITVNGQTSPAIAYSGDENAAIADAINALPGINPTVDVTSLLVSFDGNNGDGFAVSGLFVDNSAAAITAAHVTVGIAGGEPIMSAARGYPACGTFYGQRTIMGGFKGCPNVWLASEAGNYYELNTNLSASTAPMLVPIDTKGAATILDIHNGRTLDFFTDTAEYWLDGASLDRTATPNIPLGTTNGIAPTIAAVETAGTSIYAAAKGGTLFEFKFDYSEQNYQSNNISVKSSSIVKGVVDQSLRRLTGNTDVDELYCACSNGTAFALSLLRAEDVAAFAPLATDGAYIAFNVNGNFDVHFVASRLVAGQQVQFLEKTVPGLLFDQAQQITLAAKGTLVTGLNDLEGATVWALADNYVQGPFTVTGGQIALSFAATNITVGRWKRPRVLTLPQPKDIAPRTVSRRPCRVHTVRLSVDNTSSIAIGANDGSPFEVPLAHFGQPTDTPLYANPFTGKVFLEGIDGWTDDGIVEITQLHPGLLTVTGVTVEVDL